MIAVVTFTRMDESTTAEWQQILTETMDFEQGTADRILAMLASLEDLTVGIRSEPAGALAADGDPGRGGRAPPPKWSWRRSVTTSARRSRS